VAVAEAVNKTEVGYLEEVAAAVHPVVAQADQGMEHLDKVMWAEAAIILEEQTNHHIMLQQAGVQACLEAIVH